MIELPAENDKRYRAIAQRSANTVRVIHTTNRHAPRDYPALALVQIGVSELVKAYGADATADLLRELVGMLGDG